MQNFVKYLNTLHRFNGNNDNATAEANYLNKYASDILVPDLKLVETIEIALKSFHKVLLTGFAGDGKTTIARIIAKRNLQEPRTIIQQENSSRPLVIIKDICKWISEESFSGLLLLSASLQRLLDNINLSIGARIFCAWHLLLRDW